MARAACNLWGLAAYLVLLPLPVLVSFKSEIRGSVLPVQQLAVCEPHLFRWYKMLWLDHPA